MFWPNNDQILYLKNITLTILLCFFYYVSFAGYLIAPVKSEQNQTKVFEKDKLPTNQTYSHPNSISDNNNNLLQHSDDNFIDPFINKTYFRTANLSIITSQVGSIVQVPCSVHLIGDEMVSFVEN